MKLIREFHDLGDLFRRENEGTGEDWVRLRVAAECEGGYDAEVLACAADGPEEVGILRGRGGDEEA
jgi:hypothetical protein